MTPTHPQNNIFSKNKKILLSLFVLLLFFGVGIFVISNGNKNGIDSTDLYKKEIQIGSTKLNVVVKKVITPDEVNGDWLYGEYQFFTTDSKPKLLKKVESLIPPESNEKGNDPFFFMKDVTGDKIPEIFIMVERAGSGGTSYEILRLNNNELVNIKLENQKDNWVGFDDIDYKDGYIGMTWHATDGWGKALYILDSNNLKLYKNIGFVVISGSDNQCEVRKSEKNNEFKVIEKKNCDLLGRNFDQYFQ